MKIKENLRKYLIEARYTDEERAEYRKNRGGYRKKRYTDEERAEYYKNRGPRKKKIDKTTIANNDGTIGDAHIHNEVMNPEIYKLRRKIMDYIYKAKHLAGNKYNGRVEVRIADFMMKDDITRYGTIIGLGGGFKGKPRIWIPKNVILSKSIDLGPLVYHELLHALYGVGHINNSPLMNPYAEPAGYRSDKEYEELFKSHIEHVDEDEWNVWWEDNKDKFKPRK
jgi:5-hydroxyisourate hydrolase-like protein (transthyretin family)